MILLFLIPQQASNGCGQAALQAAGDATVSLADKLLGDAARHQNSPAVLHWLFSAGRVGYGQAAADGWCTACSQVDMEGKT